MDDTQHLLLDATSTDACISDSWLCTSLSACCALQPRPFCAEKPRAAAHEQHHLALQQLAAHDMLSIDVDNFESAVSQQALGTQAFSIVPLSFCIPEDLPAWEAWLTSPSAVADTGLWMLKTGQDAGKGLRLVRTQQ